MHGPGEVLERGVGEVVAAQFGPQDAPSRVRRLGADPKGPCVTLSVFYQQLLAHRHNVPLPLRPACHPVWAKRDYQVVRGLLLIGQ